MDDRKHQWAWYYSEAFTHIMKHHPRGSHWKVYCVLCNYRRWKGVHKDTCYPSYPTIAQEACVSPRSVGRIVHDLQRIKVVRIKYDKVINRKNRTVGRRRNIYTILPPPYN